MHARANIIIKQAKIHSLQTHLELVFLVTFKGVYTVIAQLHLPSRTHDACDFDVHIRICASVLDV